MNREELLKLIDKANQEIKPTDIKGKDYCEVNERVKAFRKVYPNGLINTEMKYLDGEVGKRVVGFTCEIFNDELVKLAQASAEEKENSTFINKTSFIENCETSAVGRALGFAGFGIDGSVASADEVQNAMTNQKEQKEEVAKVPVVLDKKTDPRLWLKRNLKVEQIAMYLEKYQLEKLEDMDVVLADKIKEGIIKKFNENH